MNDLVKEYYASNESFDLKFIGLSSFGDQDYYQIRATLNFDKYNSVSYSGEYKMIFLIPMPTENIYMHAVSISLLAGENSPIKEFDDFESKGLVSKIFQTFRYVEES